MKLDELQSVQSRERQTDQLQQLRATFYEEAGQFVAQLREERERAAERADDPFDAPEVNRLSDDIKTAEQTVEAIYERRVGKIVKMASLAAADMPTDDGGLTQEERALFETMVEAIEGNRAHVLDVIAGESPTGAVGGGDTETTSTPATDATPTASPEDGDVTPSPPEPADPTQATDGEPSVDAADIMGGGDGSATPNDDAGTPAPPSPGESTEMSGTEAGEPAESADRPAAEAHSAVDDGTSDSQSADVDRKTVRITDDVGEIFGVDQRSYDLSTDDVVTLPADNADPLVERDAAEPLE
jgi:DNA replication factor GINS